MRNYRLIHQQFSIIHCIYYKVKNLRIFCQQSHEFEQSLSIPLFDKSSEARDWKFQRLKRESSSTNMKKMKVFRMVKKQYAFVGITSTNQSARKSQLNTRILAGFLLFSCLVQSQFMYIFRVADGFLDYMDVICSTFSTFILFICFAAIVCNRTKLFKCIDRIEDLIDMRKSSLRISVSHQIDWKCVYSLGRKHTKSEAFFFETGQRVERLSEQVFTVVLKFLLQFLILPNCAASFSIYFITDSGRESFRAPVPMWWVFFNHICRNSIQLFAVPSKGFRLIGMIRSDIWLSSLSITFCLVMSISYLHALWLLESEHSGF